MTRSAIWQPVRDELDRWRDLGLTAELWLRDDDAFKPSPLLDRLIALTAEFGIPVALAIIPRDAEPALAERIAQETHIHPVVHGWAHANHAPLWEKKKQELGLHRPRAAVLNDLTAGLTRLSELHGERLVPMLVPPWNRIDRELVDDLPALGYRALSVFGDKIQSRPGLAVVNTHVDIIDWHRGKACQDHAWLVATLAKEMAQARSSGGRPVGILSHHMVSDEDAFRFLHDLFRAAPPERVSWRAPSELIRN
jgi:hypothetical protein